jgi:pimeloyl-ACP methyl ester carboxylesterase
MLDTRITFSGANGVRIIGHAAGPQTGPTVLLAHGGGQTKRAWAKTVQQLSKVGYRALAIDLRGHGESDWAADGAYETADFAADLLCVADALGVRPHLVGASLGGLSGLLAEGLLRPGSLASLTLVDIAPNVAPAGVERVVGFMQKHMESGFASPEEAADVIAQYTPNRAKRGASDGLKHYLRLSPDGRYRWHWDPAFITSVQTKRQSGIAHEPGMDQAVAALKLPVHLVRGASSDLLTKEAAHAFCQSVPGIVYSDIEGAGHMVVGDRNDAFAGAILGFLDSQDHTASGAKVA